MNLESFPSRTLSVANLLVTVMLSSQKGQAVLTETRSFFLMELGQTLGRLNDFRTAPLVCSFPNECLVLSVRGTLTAHLNHLGGETLPLLWLLH